ncbi:methylated-DNA--[protein]-cysteine S-methyltransferase [Chakrabartyella piscis]|uniref:methylated-DNA--[protein]-cysteine S-methyltransferase n=1 Tax=Chakrabartyella piscis TaxID=2918914 RepID=UPI00295861AE|nr:methylated-DNA--[protein]-cysteine S-methyltransferase [Chakrabartyella piscis]
MEFGMYLESPVGRLLLVEEDGYLTYVSLHKEPSETMIFAETPLLLETKQQLEDYFIGKRKDFDLPMNPKGTQFQKKVWNALMEIPYGKTVSYGEIAKIAGSPKGARAVGMANHVNPIVVVVPCHRVIGSNGKLVGYGGGVDKKVYLLDLEETHMDA